MHQQHMTHAQGIMRRRVSLSFMSGSRNRHVEPPVESKEALDTSRPSLPGAVVDIGAYSAW